MENNFISSDNYTLPHIICMGVSGSGKSTIGSLLAKYFKRVFIEGDTLHSKKNKEKMKQGIALQDIDRWQWLDIIRNTIIEQENMHNRVIISCSALKKTYRDYIRQCNIPLYFLCFHANIQYIEARLCKRLGHFMPISLLQSQFNDLELPHREMDCSIIKVDTPVEKIYMSSLECLHSI